MYYQGCYVGVQSLNLIIEFCVCFSFLASTFCHHHRNATFLGGYQSHTRTWGGSWSLVKVENQFLKVNIRILIGHKLDMMPYSYHLFLINC
jgi:hypothetical protein